MHIAKERVTHPTRCRVEAHLTTTIIVTVTESCPTAGVADPIPALATAGTTHSSAVTPARARHSARVVHTATTTPRRAVASGIGARLCATASCGRE